jgi:hypothetical protein
LLFHGIDIEFDINKAEKKLVVMMKSPQTIDGCTLAIEDATKL